MWPEGVLHSVCVYVLYVFICGMCCCCKVSQRDDVLQGSWGFLNLTGRPVWRVTLKTFPMGPECWACPGVLPHLLTLSPPVGQQTRMWMDLFFWMGMSFSPLVHGISWVISPTGTKRQNRSQLETFSETQQYVVLLE